MTTSGKVSGYPKRGDLGILTPLAMWVLVWLATVALARFGPSHLWDGWAPASWAAIAVSVIGGIGLIGAHARYLHHLDELQRKIMVDAMAVTLGGGLVAGCAYAAAEHAGLMSHDADIGILIILMTMVYLVAIAVGTVRYR